MPGSPSPFVAIQYFDNNGVPAADHQLFTYDSGTSTKHDTFTDYALTSANANPIILDAAGRCTIFLENVLYKYVLALPTDEDPPQSPLWTRDPVVPPSGALSDIDVIITAGENLTGGNCIYLSDGSGGLTAGRWYKADSDQTYSSNASYMIGFATGNITAGDTGTARISGTVTGLSGLSSGLPYFVASTAGAITASAPTNAVLVGKADSTTSLVIPGQYGDAGATIRGVMNSGTQSIGGVKTFVLQPFTYIGAAATLPATVGGVFATDVAAHAVPADQTDAVMTDTEIPANMLNANGKALRIEVGSSTANTGGNNKRLELDIGGNQTSILLTALAVTWRARIFVIRIDSDSVDLSWKFELNAATVTEAGPVRINGLDFTAAIDLRTLGTTGATSTMTQTYFLAQAVG